MNISLKTDNRRQITAIPESIYEYTEINNERMQLCPVCKTVMGDMPGSRDAICHNCGFKDPCCE